MKEKESSTDLVFKFGQIHECENSLKAFRTELPLLSEHIVMLTCLHGQTIIGGGGGGEGALKCS